MNVFTFIAMCAIVSSAAGADDTSTTHSDIRSSLEAKKAQLRKLQDEILKLGGEIGDPTRVRITLRAVEIDCVKLKQLNLSHPFGQKEGSSPLFAADFAREEELLRVLNPFVAKGCVKLVTNPSVTTSIGQSVTVTNVRELPFINIQKYSGNGASTNQDDDIAHVPGYRFEVRPDLKPDGKIALSIRFRLNRENPQATVMNDGTTIDPVQSSSVQTSIELKPGQVLDIGGGRTTVMEKIGTAPEKQSGKDDGSIRVVHREIEIHHFVVAELLPQP